MLTQIKEIQTKTEINGENKEIQKRMNEINKCDNINILKMKKIYVLILYTFYIFCKTNIF